MHEELRRDQYRSNLINLNKTFESKKKRKHHFFGKKILKLKFINETKRFSKKSMYFNNLVNPGAKK